MRAWLEIDLEKIKWNVNCLRNMMPSGCEMMAVIKANAYGHGAVPVGKILNGMGIYSFAVATVDEGIELRENGIIGDILILGYTDLKRMEEVVRYDLIQTIVDERYGEEMNKCGLSIQAELKIDSGMHRLGVLAEDIEETEKVFNLQNLRIKGMFTHLYESDSLEKEAVENTEKQIEKFDRLVDNLKQRGIVIPKLHIQSSYGLLNYPQLQYDYVRIGIALFGVLSSKQDKTKVKLSLQPALSLKALVTSVREIKSGETAGYSGAYHAEADRKIAAVSIGYADGIPRNLSGTNNKVIVHGQKTSIIGKICMDQLLIDVTMIKDVRAGDAVTLIGREGEEEVSVLDMADKAGTIANEIFSRLGKRLEMKVV